MICLFIFFQDRILQSHVKLLNLSTYWLLHHVNSTTASSHWGTNRYKVGFTISWILIYSIYKTYILKLKKILWKNLKLIVCTILKWPNFQPIFIKYLLASAVSTTKLCEVKIVQNKYHKVMSTGLLFNFELFEPKVTVHKHQTSPP